MLNGMACFRRDRRGRDVVESRMIEEAMVPIVLLKLWRK